MDSEFEWKLRAAVSAGWRILVIQVGLLTIAWFVYLTIMAMRPDAVLALWGPQVTWSTVATVSLMAIAVYKVSLWIQAALLAWGWMWGTRLRARRESPVAERSEPAQEPTVSAGSHSAHA
jgi:hypothetical protein